MAEDSTMAGAQEADLVIEATTSGIDYSLHPLVLINISDHSMRTRVTAGGGALPRVIGCLLGQHSGRAVEIVNSFEMVETPDGATCFNQELFTSKREQYAEVFPTLDVLGFYATGPAVVPEDLQLQKKLAEHIEAPLLLSMDAAGTLQPGATELPLRLYESGVHVVNGQPQTQFVRVEYNIATSDAERIGINSAAEVTTGAVGENAALARHYTGIHGALKMLADRLGLLLMHLEQMQKGVIPMNHQVLRMVSALLDRMPQGAAEVLNKELLEECTDATLVTTLSLITRGVSECQHLVDASALAYPRK